MKGIILAGGAGTRLHPVTKSVSKQLLPVYDKPMIYYPLSTLMLAGIREILIITTPDQKELFRELLGDGGQWGLSLSYEVQVSPNGIAEAFIIGADFIGMDSVALVLGDNIFFGNNLTEVLETRPVKNGCNIFCISVPDPSRYGVAVFNDDGTVSSIVEKPLEYISRWAVSGLYMFDNCVVDIAKSIRPSDRGELEITDIISNYNHRAKLSVNKLGRGYAWFDAGTHDSLLDASYFVRTIEKQQGLKIGCPEEIAYSRGWLTADQLQKYLKDQGKSSYYTYLRGLEKYA
ncbi:glucose-1-phosphate thymidylyltransferase RfbA [Amylibacter sp.]|nr:glucose-1-phosphate thymidylyltransferase RfbA [Amylibacter sp.]